MREGQTRAKLMFQLCRNLCRYINHQIQYISANKAPFFQFRSKSLAVSLAPYTPLQSASKMNPDLTASHHFTATPSVQATVISSAEYLDNLLNWSVCFSPRLCSLQPDLAPCGLHDVIHCPPFPQPVPAMGRSSNIPSILSPYGLGT